MLPSRNVQGPARLAVGFGQPLYGVVVRAAPLPALEQADGLGGEARPAGKVLLGKVGRIAVAPEQISEREPRAGFHSLCLLLGGRQAPS